MVRHSVTPPSNASRGSLFFRFKSWLEHLTSETHTRILLIYGITVLLATAISVPILRFFLLDEVNNRVRANLQAELEAFQVEYAAFDTGTFEAEATLMEFVDAFLLDRPLEDDNFYIIILDGELYSSNPRILPSSIQPGSEAMQKWLTLREPSRAAIPVADPEISKVIYKTSVLEVNNSFRGKFVVAHLAAEERVEMLAAISVLFKFGVLAIVTACLMAWLISQQLLKPIRQLSKMVQNIDESSLTQRLEVKGEGELAILARSFNAMMDRVQDSFDSQRNFINEAGHELRTPITIIQGHLELMEDDPEDRRETIELVMDELARMGRFIHDLTLLAKAERPDFLQKETIDLGVLTAELFNKVTALAERNWRLSGVGQGRLLVDRQRITAAIVNLAQNATQHTQPTDTIELGSILTEGQVQFWVRDSGEGISPADQKRIFERFARGANSDRRIEGVGLGLAIVKAIAEAHGGHIELVSQPGAGSTFSLILPIEQA